MLMLGTEIRLASIFNTKKKWRCREYNVTFKYLISFTVGLRETHDDEGYVMNIRSMEWEPIFGVYTSMHEGGLSDFICVVN